MSRFTLFCAQKQVQAKKLDLFLFRGITTSDPSDSRSQHQKCRASLFFAPKNKFKQKSLTCFCSEGLLPVIPRTPGVNIKNVALHSFLRPKTSSSKKA